MRRSMVFWDTRCSLTRFACRKSVGQATSRRSAGDVRASTYQSVVVFPVSAMRRAKRTGGGANFRAVFRRGSEECESPPISVPADQ